MPDETDQKLREMAEHRGFKLVKSRKRKPGAGDYGMFGLTDARGKALLGIAETGLTASAQDIKTFLRKGAESTWKASANSVPARAKPDEKPRTPKTDDNAKGELAIRRHGRKSAISATIAGADEAFQSGKSRDSSKPPRVVVGTSRKPTRAVSVSPKAKPKAHTVANPPPPSDPSPQLRIRAARSADAYDLARLLQQLANVTIDELGVARNLDAARKAKGGMVIAELNLLVGCCSWALLPTIQHGLIGRITMILVKEDHRRQGIATALVEAASALLIKAGCARMEAMSDIEIRNAHGFFRTLQFEQTSYRFARLLGGDAR